MESKTTTTTTTKKKTKLIERDKICSSQRSGLEVLGKEELKEGDPPGKGDLHQKYKLPFIRHWRCKAQDDAYSYHCCTMYMKVVKRVILSARYKEKHFFPFLFIVST